MIEYVNNIIEDSIKAHNRFARENGVKLVEFAKTIVNCLNNGGKILICGNGGSAADAQHIAAEFVGRFVMERPSLPAIALTTDTSLLTAVSNDYSFDEVFEKQVSCLANENDIVWGISTSGNSENVVRALRKAAKKNITTLGFSGKDGGQIKGICDLVLVVEEKETARIQELHILSAHIICGLVDEIMFGRFAGF